MSGDWSRSMERRATAWHEAGHAGDAEWWIPRQTRMVWRTDSPARRVVA